MAQLHGTQTCTFQILSWVHTLLSGLTLGPTNVCVRKAGMNAQTIRADHPRHLVPNLAGMHLEETRVGGWGPFAGLPAAEVGPLQCTQACTFTKSEQGAHTAFWFDTRAHKCVCKTVWHALLKIRADQPTHFLPKLAGMHLEKTRVGGSLV